MPTDAEIDAFFAGLEARRDQLARQYRAGWPFSLAGCGVGCLVPIVLVLAFAGFRDQWREHPLYATGVVSAWVTAIACAGIGIALYWRAQRIYAPIDAAVDAELMAPFAAFLVPGGTLEHPALDACVEWRPSLLFTRHAHAHQNAVTRVTGRLAGQPAVLDEIRIRHRNHKNSGAFTGWVVRVELPFAVGGHLRAMILPYPFRAPMWNDGFDRLTGAEARLGAPYEVDGAAPGVTPEGADGPTSSGVPMDALLTDAVVERLRREGRMQLAATGRTLWITVPRLRVLDARSGTAVFGGKDGRTAIAAIADVEALVREVLRAGTART
jgi:hypothetical protein